MEKAARSWHGKSQDSNQNAFDSISYPSRCCSVLTLSFFFFLSFPILHLFGLELHFFTGITRSEVYQSVHFLFHVACLFLGRFLLLFGVLGMTTMTVLCALSTLTPNHCSFNMISMNYVTIQNWLCRTVCQVWCEAFVANEWSPPSKKLRHTSQWSIEACLDWPQAWGSKRGPGVEYAIRLQSLPRATIMQSSLYLVERGNWTRTRVANGLTIFGQSWRKGRPFYWPITLGDSKVCHFC